MEKTDDLLIVVDPGHGGWDNGASFEGRLEKDDNLRLGLEVRKQMEAQGIRVLMTRDTDEFIELRDRANLANTNNADLFISLHRNSYIEQTPSTNGVENFIYLTAPMETSGKAAELVLQEVVDVGVQSNRGVNRGNYYVVRRTIMPAMLLEMGFIINEEDNRLFDEKLVPYAQAITRGAMKYFNLEYKGDIPDSAPPPPPAQGINLPPSPVGPVPYQYIQSGSVIPRSDGARTLQQTLNLTFGSNLPVDGILGPQTMSVAITALQATTNANCNTNLTVDGRLGPQTEAAIPEYSEGDRGNAVTLIQALLAAKGYDAGGIDGIYGPRTKTAVQLFQRDNYLAPDGIAGPLTITALLN